MRRREFISLLGGATAAWPISARAQQPQRMRRIGALLTTTESDPEGRVRASTFQQGLQQLGWKIGGNVQIDYRWGAGDADSIRRYAAELVALKPDVIFASTSVALASLQGETQTIPIVFAQVTDPVAAGFVSSLARPGGNITGFALYEHGLAVKWLELLKQIAPGVTRVTIIYYPAVPQAAGYLREIDVAAPTFSVQVSTATVRNVAEIERAIVSATGPNSGLIVLPTSLTLIHRDLIIRLAARHRLPAVYAYRYYVTSGGLASYGVDNLDQYRRAASYVDRILKGEKPGDLPVQQATKFQLVINLKTAKALGLEIPILVLARTDEVIE